MTTMTLQQAFELALRHHQAGQLAQAESIYRQVLAQQPDHGEAMHFLGVLTFEAGRRDAGIELLQQSIHLRPNWDVGHMNLANALKENGRLDEAIIEYRKTVALNPASGQAWIQLGDLLKQQRVFDGAITAYRQAIALGVRSAGIYHHLGFVLAEMGRLSEAVVAYRQGLALGPETAEIHNDLGNALCLERKHDQAIAAYRRAVALKPGLADACNNLGNALNLVGRLDEAIAAYRQAIVLQPDFSYACSNLGLALAGQGQLDEAMAVFRQAIALDPRNADSHSNLVYWLSFCPDYDAQAIAREHRQWNRLHAEPLRRFIKPHVNPRDPNRRLRIGYVSADLRDHVVGRNLLPLFARHNREQFEVTCYANLLCPDEMTPQFRRWSDRWRSIVGMSDERVAEQIRSDGIDILVDLSLHLWGNRLLVFARKPAPVQATFAGYPGSTGLSAIDYRLSDPYLDPPGTDESVYSEQTIRLPNTFWCYDPLDYADIGVNPLPASDKGMVTFGCLNNFGKVTPPMLMLWAQILQRVNSSRLVLMAKSGSHRQQTIDLLSQEGILPQRVEFIDFQSRRDYLRQYHRIDIGLDTLPYNGHTTSLESLWMGVPVVTLVGKTVVGRAGFSQLSNLKLTQLAAQTPEEFVQAAADLAHDLPRLAELRATLRGRMERSPLMDAAGFARGVESAYRQMWQAYLTEPPC
jgi:predicted O-linked N-acetylglucosamine transferase (SPINDLY family)